VTRHDVARVLLWPVYPIRGWVLDRKYSRTPPHNTVVEHGVRLACERILDAVEMWAFKPDFQRMDQQLEKCRQFQAELAELGLVPPHDPKGETK
jgi:hypothetical protein